jgi:hypothetical protein
LEHTLDRLMDPLEGCPVQVFLPPHKVFNFMLNHPIFAETRIGAQAEVLRERGPRGRAAGCAREAVAACRAQSCASPCTRARPF